MLDELRAAPLLRGVRGEPPVDRAALVDAVTRFARLVADCPELAEIELNPLVARPDGVVAIDARARLAPGPGGRPP
jgi:acyl-CoA synthetase (NDP forming)